MQTKVYKYQILISAISTLFFILSTFGFLNSVNNIFLDSLYGETAPRPEIVVIKIDDQSLQEIGSWPWDRSIFANAITKIEASKPAVIGIDVLFLESRSGDDALEKVLKNEDLDLVLGSKLVDSKGTNIYRSVFKDAKSGFVNFDPDSDGKIRESLTYSNVVEECELSFSLEVLRNYFKLNKTDLCDREFSLRNSDFKLNSKDSLRFSYTTKPFNQISFKDVLSGKFEDDYFKDKIVLIGSTAIDLRSNLNDNFVSVFGDSIPGVMIHANIINSFLSNTFYTFPNIIIYTLVILILNLLLTFCYFKIKKIWVSGLLLLFSTFVVFMFSIVAINFNILTFFVGTFLSLVLGFGLSLVSNYKFRDSEVRFVKGVFSRYLNRDLLEILIKDTSKLSLGGETKNMTVLFSDIRGFTSISEKMTSQELIQMINDYLNFMSQIILENKGTIDKYIGDAIMAIWNAPLDDNFHATNAIKASLLMKESLEKFNKEFPNYPEINIGIGVNSGDMTVGNVGGKDRFDYTVLGDNVNLGSRLEGLTKKYGVTIIVSEATFESFQNENAKSVDIIFRLLDEVKVKGKETAIKIYEPLGQNKENEKIKKDYEEAFSYYQKGDFGKSLDMLAKIKNDSASTKLLERITNLGSEDKKSWNGVWKWEEK